MSNLWQKLSQQPSLWLTILTINGYSMGNANIAQAQVIPDNTLGNEASVVNQINQTLQQIEGGALRGENLFHSFLEFSIKEGNGVYFANPANVINIFSRVTGNNISQILGTLGVLGNANLYLLNPNGILFGPNAQLDIAGSFIASSGSSFILPNGMEFSGTNPQAVPLLTVNTNAPIGIKLEGSEGILTNQGQLKVGNNLTLAGNQLDFKGQIFAQGDITLQALDKITIRDTVDNPVIIASELDLLIQGNQIDIFALNNPNSAIASYGNLTLKSPNPVIGDVHYWSGGNFRVENQDSSLGNLQSIQDPVIRTGGDVLIGGYEGASLHIIAGGSVTIPSYVLITGADANFALTETITLSNGQQINIDGKNNPTLDIRAGVSPEFIGTPFIQWSGLDLFFNPLNFPTTATSADIKVGTIIFRNAEDITQKITGNVLLTNQYQPNPNLTGNITIQSTLNLPDLGLDNIAIETGGNSNGGWVAIDSQGNVEIDGAILSQSNNLGGEVIINSLNSLHLLDNAEINVQSADGGNINVTTKDLTMDEGSRIRAGINTGLGNTESQAGDINIKATGDIKLVSNNAGIANQVRENSNGNAGNINITANNINLNNGSFLSTVSFANGNAGNITLNITNTANFDYSSVYSLVEPTGVGNGGEINIKARNLEVVNGTDMAADTYGKGNAGNIIINATDSVKFDGVSSDNFPSVARSTVGTDAVGNAGKIEINTGDLTVSNGAFLRTSTAGLGNAGNITLDTDNLRVSNGSSLNTSSESMANAGKVKITSTGDINFSGDSYIVTASLGGNGGDVSIKTNGDIILSKSQIYSNSSFATDINHKGGDININANSLTLKDNSTLFSFGSGIDNNMGSNAGKIKIKTSPLGFVKLDGDSDIYSSTNNAGAGGNVLIDTGKLFALNGSQISTEVRGSKDAGSLTINASESVEISGSQQSDFGYTTSGLATSTNGSGNAGKLTIKTLNLLIQDGGYIETTTSGAGKAGELIINAPVAISLIGNTPDGLNASVIRSLTDSTGNADNIQINTGKLTVKDGGYISTESLLAEGAGGNLNITATDSIEVSGNRTLGGNSSSLSAQTSGSGKAGDIQLKTNSLIVKDGGEISSTTLGKGSGGNVDITANSSVNIEGENALTKIPSRITTKSFLNSEGNAGDISLKTRELTISNRGEITSSTDSIGKAGSININADNTLIDTSNPQANNPNLNIKFIKNGFISASTTATGDGGNITITALENINIQGLGKIFVETSGSGNAGNITLESGNIHIKEGVEISASTTGIGNAGNINLNALNLNLNNATIQALTESSGNPGSILINNDNNNTDDVNLTNSIISTEIKAEGEATQPANITIKTDNLNLDNAKINASTISNRNAGNISIFNSQSISLINQSEISALTTGSGKAGNLNFNLAKEIKIDSGSILNVETQGKGDAGDISITADIISIGENAELSARTKQLGEGKAGNITLNANQLNISGKLGIFAETEGVADAGNLTINPLENNPNLIISFINRGNISASTLSSGDGGDINITAPENINISGDGVIAVETRNSGDAGTINLITENLNLNEGVTITASTLGSGNAGNINLSANFINLNQAQINAFTDSTGNAGNITINYQGNNNSNLVSLSNNSQISTEIRSNGEALSPSNITINSDNLGLENSTITASTSGKGNAGNISIVKSDDINLNNSGISASTSGFGDTGEINLLATEKINLINSQINSSVETGGVGNSLTVKLSSPELNLDNSQINAFTDGMGNAGQIVIPDSKILYLDRNSKISTAIASNGITSESSNIEINASQVFLNNNSQITAETDGQGKAGSINLNIAENLTLNKNSIISSAALENASQDGGNINIKTPKIDLDNQSIISVNSDALISANAGAINIDTQEIILNNQSPISGSTSGGIGGNITINAEQLNIENGGQITSTTSGKSQAGSINLFISKNINLSGFNTGILAGTDLQSMGNGGNIYLQTPELLIENGGIIGVDSLGEGEGGNLTISTQNLSLNQGIISAETTSGNGGNINLTVNEFLTMRNDSKISTTAGNEQTGGNGGNINIFARYIFTIPEENNDITANAFTGKGGQIFITTEAIFGIEPRNELTFLSDLTASSQLGIDGIIEITRLNVDPLEGLTNLPETTAEVKVAQGCDVGGKGSISFYDLGKGGLPAKPEDYLTDDGIITPWIPLKTENESNLWNLDHNNSVVLSKFSRIMFNFSCHFERDE